MKSKLAVKSTRKVLALVTAGLIASSFPLSAQAAPTEISRWKFDEQTAGAAAQDSVGGINGNANGNPYPTPSTDVPYTSPANPGSMFFDGQNYYEVANNLAADFSICAWIKTASTGGDWHFTAANIVDAETGGFALDFGFGIESQGRLIFGNGGNIIGQGDADANVVGTKVVNDNAWHHVCVSRNNTTGENILYVDGAQDAVGITGVGLVNSNPLLRIAGGFDGNAPFVGNIDDLRFFSNVVSAADVASIFTPAPVVEEEPLVLEEEETEVRILASSGALADTGVTTWPSFLAGALLLSVGATSLVLQRSAKKQEAK